jgi:pimeloyl-ACP methyl ester carboxylesterase
VPANLNVVPLPGAPAGDGDAYITQSAFSSCMANGLPAREAKVLAVTQLPIATSALADASGVPAWQTIPSWAVVGTADQAIPPALQLAMAENAHARITEVNAPHLSMISDPGVVTSVILRAVQATPDCRARRPATRTPGRHHGAGRILSAVMAAFKPLRA